MRLVTVNLALARRLQAIEDTDETRRIFEDVFRACVRQMDAELFAYLGDVLIEESLKMGRMPERFEFEQNIDWLDNRFSMAEREGRNEEAAAYFSLARLMSALFFARRAKVPADYAEAVYEAIMSLPEPQTFVLGK